jgi:hypothetical protein
MNRPMISETNHAPDPLLDAALDSIAAEDRASAPAGLESRVASATSAQLAASLPPAPLPMARQQPAARNVLPFTHSSGLRLAAALAIVGTVLAAIVASRSGLAPSADKPAGGAPLASADQFDPLADEFLAFAWGDATDSGIDSLRAAAEQLGQRLEGDIWGISDLLSDEGST